MRLFRRNKGAAVIILSGFVIVFVCLTALGCLQVKITLSLLGENSAISSAQRRDFVVPNNVTCGNRTGLREGRQLDRNSTQVKHVNEKGPVKMETALPPKYPDDGVPKVIIVGYYRGGTSLTGSLFNWNPNSIYYFEPLHFLFQTAVNRGFDIIYNNGTEEIPPSRGHEVPYVHQFLKGLLTCNFDEVNRGTLAGNMAPMCGPDIHQFSDCLRKGKKKSRTHSDICLKKLQERCLKKDVRVVKEIRLRMESTRGLLKALPSLKVIHLIRDSRGLLCSQTSATCRISDARAFEVCGQMYIDIKHRLKLEKEFPGRLMTLRYEDLAVNPLHTAKSVYDFVKLKVPVSVGRQLYNATIRGKKPNGMLDVVRLDSLKTAFGWKKYIKWDVAKSVQNICRPSLQHGNYRLYAEEKDLRNEKLPVRKHHKLEDTYKN